jgi:hypothetical protein
VRTAPATCGICGSLHVGGPLDRPCFFHDLVSALWDAQLRNPTERENSMFRWLAGVLDREQTDVMVALIRGQRLG